ncbi:MAG: methionine--tRNA ligase [Candidatus Nitrosothermus koennekii]|nr:MAG: methionine--tRNA ligase [Candidatus Nitrosothermus koennekii]
MNMNITVTSALPYANGELHLGHVASTYLPADIFVRYCRLKRYNIVYSCATDDFGTPILIKAEQEGKHPKDYVAYWHKRDCEDFTNLGISFDIFDQTSSDENIRFVQYVFKRLYENGYIYPKDVVQFYCQYDKKFLPDRYVIGRCPYCNADDQYSDICEQCGRVPEEILEPKCAICRNPPIKKSSKHYFFKLSAFSSRLKEWLIKNENLQKDIKNYVLRWIEEGLQDWDITRDITWGVPIPLEEAEGKVLYGWFDNHLCYISSTLKYFNSKGIDGKEFWNSSIIYHFIGKDIVYHHYLFLPAMRMGIDEEYKLPDYIPTRGHLMLQNQKISKSRNWYISLRDFLSLYPADYLRFYMASITPYSQEDLNFDWDEFAARINNELIANIGNFINRALSFTNKKFDSIVPEPSEYDSLDNNIIDSIKSIADEVGSLIFNNELDKGLKKILAFSNTLNQYFQAKEPWSDREKAKNCIYISVNAVRSLAILIAPYLPFSAENIWMQLNLKGSVFNEDWDSASKMLIKPNHRINKAKPLFKKVEEKDIEEQKKRLGVKV